MILPKFRAFIHGEMVYFDKVEDVSKMIAFCGDRWVYLKHDWVYAKSTAWEAMYVTGNADDENIPLMIYSDYNDKKGAGIWEGDIIAAENKKDTELAIVKFELPHGIYVEGVESKTRWDYQNSESIYHINFLEVLGNIYEHTTILEEGGTP